MIIKDVSVFSVSVYGELPNGQVFKWQGDTGDYINVKINHSTYLIITPEGFQIMEYLGRNINVVKKEIVSVEYR